MSMQLFVNTLSGKTLTLDIPQNTNTYAVKQLIQDKEGIPADSQVLLFSGKSLVNETTLSESSITGDMAFLQLTLSLLGGGKKKKKKVFDKPKKEKHKKKKIKLAVLKYYKIDEHNKITRLRRECTNQNCGAATFMASHQDRYTCGRCGYTLVFQEKADA